MLSVSHYTITDKRIKKSATFVMIADLHNAEFGDKNEELIKEIKKIAPDAVLIAGDVIVGKKDVGSGVAIDLCKSLEVNSLFIFQREIMRCEPVYIQSSMEISGKIYMDRQRIMFNGL